MKDLKDYLHLYFGSICQITWTEQCSEEMGFEDGLHRINGIVLQNLEGIESGKLHVRPLSDMSEDEGFVTICKNTFYPCYFSSKEKNYIGYRQLFTSGRKSKIKWEQFPVNPKTAESVKYLLSKYFDLFGLIEAGLAIDSTTIKP